jgi:hypothetical protein
MVEIKRLAIKKKQSKKHTFLNSFEASILDKEKDFLGDMHAMEQER